MHARTFFWRKQIGDFVKDFIGQRIQNRHLTGERQSSRCDILPEKVEHEMLILCGKRHHTTQSITHYTIILYLIIKQPFAVVYQTPPFPRMKSFLISTLILLSLLVTQSTIAFSPITLCKPTKASSSLRNMSYLDSLVPQQHSDDYSTPTTSSSSHNEFTSIPQLSLNHADAIANNVIACCHRNGFNPVTVYVLDAWGSTLVSKRMDRCSPVGIPDFAKAKAFSCVVNKYPSRVFRDRYTAEEASAKFGQMLGMVAISQGQMAPFPGGILITLEDNIVGTVGVSGAAGDEDEYCAIRGVIESNFGLTTVPETHSCSTVQDRF
jgi:glc operon protein GlcG